MRFLIPVMLSILAAWIYHAVSVSKNVAASGLRVDLSLSGRQEKVPIFAGCENPRRGWITFASRAIFPVEFASGINPEQLASSASAAARKQMQYLTGFVNSDDSYRPLQMHLLQGSDQTVRSVKRIRYGKSLKFSPFGSENQLLYPASFRNGRELRTSSPAVSVSYTGVQEIVVCDPKKNFRGFIDLKLPHDPYLAYWSVREDNRRKLSFKSSTSVTNPCADVEMADLKLPSMYWYSWNPDAHGIDNERRPFDCRELLKDGRDFVTTRAVFKEGDQANHELDFNSLQTKSTITARLIFGYMEFDRRPERLAAIRRYFSVHRPDINMIRNLNFDTFQRHNPDLDPSVLSALYFVRRLDQSHDLEKLSIEEREAAVILKLRGTLRFSRKTFDVEVFIGPTDEPQHYAYHRKFLEDALQVADIIIYVGHSGMGANMNLFSDANRRERAQAISKGPPYQFLAILGCYTTQYFATDYFDLRSVKNQTSDLLLVASRRYLVGMPASLISFFDQRLAGAPVSAEKFFRTQIIRDEMVYLDRKVAQ